MESEVDIDKIQNVGTELKNCIKSIEWDLEDLDQTISKLLAFVHSHVWYWCVENESNESVIYFLCVCCLNRDR